MVQFAKSQGNTFSGAQKTLTHETKGFGLVVLCQKCNPRLNHTEFAVKHLVDSTDFWNPRTTRLSAILGFLQEVTAQNPLAN